MAFLNGPQLGTLERILHSGRKIKSVRFFPDTGELQVAWQTKGGMMYRWVGRNGKFVYK